MQLHVGIVDNGRLGETIWAPAGLRIGTDSAATLHVERTDFPASIEVIVVVDGVLHLVLSALEEGTSRNSRQTAVLVDGAILPLDRLRALSGLRDGHLLPLTPASRGGVWVRGVKLLFRYLDPSAGPPWPP